MTVFENVAVAVRQIQKNKVFASIIVFALSIGTAACLLIFQYASYELSFDRHNPYFRNAYRVNMRMFENNIFRYETARTPKYVLREIRERIPGIDASVRFNSTGWSGSPILDSNRSPIVFGTGSPDPFSTFSICIVRGFRAANDHENQIPKARVKYLDFVHGL